MLRSILTSRTFWLVVLAIYAAWLFKRSRSERRASMAKRYGSRYSPKGDRRSQGADGPEALRPPRPADAKRVPRTGLTIAITLAASPLLIGAFMGDALHLARNFAGFALIAGAMFMTREGLAAEAAYNARRVSRRPAFPRKLFGMVLTGLGLGVSAYEPSAGLAPPLVMGVVGAVLHRMCFGGDPMRDKGMEGFDGIQQDRVIRITEEGEAHLTAMTDAALRLRDRQLETRVASFAATARELFRNVQENPAALAPARRYLGVYLLGARDATVKFADQYTAQTDPAVRAEMRSDYEALLSDLEANFTARSKAVQEGGREDLDIEVQVLRDRLAREGVRIATPSDTPPPLPPRE